jgi:hypothetical protein
MSRPLKIFLELGAGLFAALAFIGAAIVLRLASGPLPLDAVAPTLAAALSNPQSGVVVGIDHALVRLGKGARLELIARGVRVSAGQDGNQIALPELAVDLSLRAALRGVIAPSRIVLEQPVLHLSRDRDGAFHLGLDRAGETASEPAVRQVLRDLSGPIDPGAPIAALTELAIRRAEIVVEDQALGVSWRAEDADLLLRRNAGGVRGSLSLSVAATHINGEVIYARAQDRLDARLTVGDLTPAAWAAAAPALAPLAVLDLPVSGTVQATLDPSRLAILAASCDLRLGAGRLHQPLLPGEAVAVAAGRLAATYDPQGGKVVIEDATLRLDGPSVAVSGTVNGVGGGLLAGAWPRALDAAFDIDVRDVTVASLPQLWPEPVAPHARHWVLTHVHEGFADRGALHLGLALDLDSAEELRVSALSGAFAYRGVGIEYLGTMPPARGIDGTASFDDASMSFAVTGATILGMRAGDARIGLTDLDTPASRIAINLGIGGTLRDALAVLDAEPLHATRALGLADAGLAGTFDARIAIAFPLVEHLSARQVNFSADATLTDVALPRVAFGRDLTGGAFRLTLERQTLQLDGTAAIAAVPVALGLTRSVGPDAPADLQVTLRARLDEGARQALELDYPDMLSGTVGVDLAYTPAGGDRAAAQVALDLGASGLDIAPLGWHKPAGVAATARFGLRLDGDRVTAIRDASVSGGGLEAQLAVDFGPDGTSVSRVDLARLAVGATDASGSAVRGADDAWRITLAGRSFDATALRQDYRHFMSGSGRAIPFALDATLDRLVLGAGRAASGVRVRLVSDGVHWQAASADAMLDGGTPARLRFGTVAGAPRLDLQTDDLGGLLRLFDLSDDVTGGHIQVAGAAFDDGPRRRLKLTADGSDYRVVNAPLLTRLLALASFSGITALLNGEGIPFSRLHAELVVGEDRIAFDDLHAYGGAIGISANGAIDRDADTLDLSGTLVPAYTLNTVLGNIPVIGNLLMGGEGEGIFGANFRVAGPVSEPKISVNPLSALAPGILRKLFLFAPGNPTVEAASPPGDAPR